MSDSGLLFDGEALELTQKPTDYDMSDDDIIDIKVSVDSLNCCHRFSSLVSIYVVIYE